LFAKKRLLRKRNKGSTTVLLPFSPGGEKTQAPAPGAGCLLARTALRFSNGPVAQKLASLKQFARLIDPFCDARLRDNGSERKTEIVVLFEPHSGGLPEAASSAGG
jgi:hypothetical protein